MKPVDRPIKILLFSSLFPHTGEPSLGIFVANRLKQLLAHENVKATVIAPVPWFPFNGAIWGSYGRAARAKHYEKVGDVEVFHPRFFAVPKFGMRTNPFFMRLTAVKALKSLFKRGKSFDLIDAHYLYPDGVAASFLSKKFNLPLVMTARGSDVTQVGLIEGPRQKIIAASKQASHLITVSNNLRRDLISMGVPANKITTLRNGVDLLRFRETERQSTRDQFGNGKIMLFAGWLIPRKRLDIVVKVTARLKDITTVVVGSGPLESYIKKEAGRLGIEDRLVLCGQVDPADMPRYFSAADVLLLPSDREGWANVLLEALACGTPVVTRAVGGAPDLITENVAGRVVDSDSPELIAEAVADVLQSDYAREQVRAFAENYDWKETSQGQRRIFAAALGRVKDAEK